MLSACFCSPYHASTLSSSFDLITNEMCGYFLHISFLFCPSTLLSYENSNPNPIIFLYLNRSYSWRSICSLCDTSVCGALQCERSEQICSMGRSGCVSSAGYVLPKQIHLSSVLGPPPTYSSFSAFTPTLVTPLPTTSSYRFYSQQNGAVDLFALSTHAARISSMIRGHSLMQQPDLKDPYMIICHVLIVNKVIK
jgi:hypothetical protein